MPTGGVTIPALIPAGTLPVIAHYRCEARHPEGDGRRSEFRVKPGETLKLPDYRESPE